MEGSTEIQIAPPPARAGRESPGATPPSAAGTGLRLVVGRYQLPLFLLLTALISWAFVLPTGGALLPYGPTLAAGVVLAAVAGRRGVAGLWRQTSRWRVGWRWYLIAPGLIVVAHLGALGLSLALGAEVVNTAHLRSLPVYTAGSPGTTTSSASSPCSSA